MPSPKPISVRGCSRLGKSYDSGHLGAGAYGYRGRESVCMGERKN